MSVSDEPSLDDLPLDLVRQIDSIASKAERLSRQGVQWRAEDFLSAISSLNGRAVLLEELLLLELESLHKAGRLPTADQWRNRFPEHQAVVNKVLIKSAQWHSTLEASADDTAPDSFPNVPGYEIVRLLGRGAMGIVFLAKQQSLRRLVALKIVAPGADHQHASSAMRREAEAIARLRHPNIVQVFEIGEVHGKSYLTIEYVEGKSLRELLVDGPIAPRMAAELLDQVAKAVHHAHVNGIIHRDLKPANILLTQAVDQPASPARSSLSPPQLVPKVADFGLAMYLDAMHITPSQSLLGTPKYMAPEQAERLEPEDIGPSTDVYALGAIFFELLTGRTPFDSASTWNLLKLISTGKVIFPVDTIYRVPADLKAVCLKCLEKSPQDRYGSALELANDLQCYLSGYPVAARRSTRLELFTKFVARNRILSTSILTILLMLVAASVSITVFALRESSARRRAEEATASIDALRRNERLQVYWANLHLAQQAWRGARVDHMRQYLEQAITATPDAEELRDFEWNYLWKQANAPKLVFSKHQNLSNVAFSSDGKSIASPDVTGSIRVFARNTGDLQFELAGRGAVQSVAFSPDGKMLAVAKRDGWLYLWDLESQKIVRQWRGHEYPPRTLTFSPDGQQLTSCDEKDSVTSWNVEDGQTRWTFSQPDLHPTGLSYDMQGHRVAVGGGLGNVTMLDADTGQILTTISAHTNWLTGVAFHPNSQQIATSSEDRTAKVWNVADGSLAFELVGHDDVVTGVAYSPDGLTIGTSSRDGMVKLWDAKTGEHRMNLLGHSNWVMSLSFASDGQQVASVSIDATACVWSTDLNAEMRTLVRRNVPLTCVTYDPSAQRMIIGDLQGGLTICNATDGSIYHEIAAHQYNLSDVEVIPHSHLIATCGQDHLVKIWNMETGELLRVLKGHTAHIRALAVAPDGRKLYTASEDKTVRVWDVESGEENHQLKLPHSQLAMALSPDGSVLATSGTKRIGIWETTNWTNIKQLDGHTHVISSLAFSPDGQILASGGTDRAICLWNVKAGKLIHKLLGHSNLVTSLSFNRSGRRLASGSHDCTVRLWDTTAGYELLGLKHHKNWVNCVTFDPSDCQIASASQDQTVKVVE